MSLLDTMLDAFLLVDVETNVSATLLLVDNIKASKMISHILMPIWYGNLMVFFFSTKPFRSIYYARIFIRMQNHPCINMIQNNIDTNNNSYIQNNCGRNQCYEVPKIPKLRKIGMCSRCAKAT